MGADIHFYTEIKIENEWHPIYMPMPEDAFKTELKRHEGYFNNLTNTYWEDYYSKKNYANYSGRNYYLFTFLAGVRGNENPLIEPRGLPEDCSKLIRRVCEKWGSDGHSHTYYYLSELMECDWKDWFQDDAEDNKYGHPLAGFFEEYLPRLYGLDPDRTRFVMFWDN
jgi:hypothetical protein